MAPITLAVERIPSAIGTIVLMTDEQDRVRALDWDDYGDRMHRLLRRHYGPAGVVFVDRRSPSSARRALEAYFSGHLTAIDDVAVETGGTVFQRETWAALRRIPAGQTMSYGALAAEIGRPRAVRAVGLANGANPIGIVVPCHRVIGADRSLTGYGGGLDRKRWLLQHEAHRTEEL
jgi:methylated-DNA-[protein]-cysteine S-methyltransferase